MMVRRILALLLLLASWPAFAKPLLLFDGQNLPAIVHEDTRSATLAAEMLARDLQALTGKKPVVSAATDQCLRLCIIVGRRDSAVVKAVSDDTGVDLAALDGQWERYVRVSARSRVHQNRQYLLIAGSDPRGAIWGVVDLSREMGVSPWEWWADVTPRRTSRIMVDGAHRMPASPSVWYRGIFLNDEDWGLQPWAAKSFEPETGDIGPRTYARIFELMWRLKANLIWPAMHDSTRPFYEIPGNAEAARDHAIVVGTSHAEPMMRNNVREWDEKVRGPFNFFTNRAAMTDYWRERAEEVKDSETITTIGLRGKHDSAMEGAGSATAARDALVDVIEIQRGLLSSAQSRAAAEIPQALTLYKEVLDVYATGLVVPDDVTLVWPEDNYGYISRLPDEAERQRSGGNGVYYHISYWGRPHDYLWLATTHPALIREQMQRAWQLDAKSIWVVNVGDIKPGEYLTQYFLDLAFDGRLFDSTAAEHLEGWLAAQFGTETAPEIASIMLGYYDLAFERKPEFMGFSQTEPTRPIRIGDYVRTGGEEAPRRIDSYAALVERAEAVAAKLPADRQDAYFQLVLYPVRAAAGINERNLRLDLAALHIRQGRASANSHSDLARAAHQRIVADTAAYNALNGGKWNHMMDMAPRRLPVFAEPPFPQIDLAGLKPSSVRDAVPDRSRIISLAAADVDLAADAAWEVVPGLGSRGASLRASLSLDKSSAQAGPSLVYPFKTGDVTEAEVRLVAIPVHPLGADRQLRIAVQVNDGPPRILDFATHGRSEEWKQNVLTNSAVRSILLGQLPAGAHRIMIRALDPGFVLDRIDVRLNGAPDYYGAPPIE